MKLTDEGDNWLTFYNFKGVFTYFEISSGYLTNFKISGEYLIYHSSKICLFNRKKKEKGYDRSERVEICSMLQSSSSLNRWLTRGEIINQRFKRKIFKKQIFLFSQYSCSSSPFQFPLHIKNAVSLLFTSQYCFSVKTNQLPSLLLYVISPVVSPSRRSFFLVWNRRFLDWNWRLIGTDLKLNSV
jgi:hypothetical protein